MQQLIRQYNQKMAKPEGEVPVIVPGDTIRVHINLYEGGSDHMAGLKKIHRIAARGKQAKQNVERIQVFEGTVLSVKGTGTLQKITIRKISSGVGVEKTYFVHSAKINKLEVTRHGVVRRAKLYYLRDRVGKATRLKEKRVR